MIMNTQSITFKTHLPKNDILYLYDIFILQCLKFGNIKFLTIKQICDIIKIDNYKTIEKCATSEDNPVPVVNSFRKLMKNMVTYGTFFPFVYYKNNLFRGSHRLYAIYKFYYYRKNIFDFSNIRKFPIFQIKQDKLTGVVLSMNKTDRYMDLILFERYYIKNGKFFAYLNCERKTLNELLSYISISDKNSLAYINALFLLMEEVSNDIYKICLYSGKQLCFKPAVFMCENYYKNNRNKVIKRLSYKYNINLDK